MIIEISSNDFLEIQNGYNIAIFEKLKIKNEIWEFHKNDPDPSPSMPHGHNNKKKEKLNVYTGEVYNILTKKVIRKLKTRNLLMLKII